MDQPQIAPPLDGDPPMDPLALASVVLGILGMGVACCGSFVCMGWLAWPMWLIGLVLGGVSAVRHTDRNRWIGVAGIACNVVPIALMIVLTVLGVSASVLQGLMNN
jgi:hypothetical protein